MRVLIVSPWYPPATEWGGPVFSVPLMARAVKDRGVELEVFTTNTRGDATLQRVPQGTHVVDSVPVHFFNTLGPRSYFFSPGLTRALLRRARGFDLVHVQGLFLYPTVAVSRIFRLLGVPYLVTPRGMLDPWSLSQKGIKKWTYLGLCERGSLMGAARVHFTSERERVLAPSFVSSLPSVVVPNPVDVAAFDSPPRRQAGRLVRLIIAGRIHKKKGFDLLIPALGRVKRTGRQVHLTIAGFNEGNYAARVQQLARRHGVQEEISFAGNLDRPRLAAAFRRAHVALMPSYQENFGMSAAEAMVSGLPVVVSHTVNIAPDIARCGAGITVPLEVAPLAAAVTRLVDSARLRTEMGAKGRALVRSEFFPDRVARRMVAVYEDILRGTTEAWSGGRLPALSPRAPVPDAEPDEVAG